MYQGARPTDKSQETEIDVLDSDCVAAAAKELRHAIFNGELELYAMLSSGAPTRLINQTLIESAFFPANAVMTFYSIDRHPAAPFDLSWQDLNKLTRDPLCLEEKAFRRLFDRQVRKRARTHKLAGEAWKSPGRPSEKMDKAIEAIEELHDQGKVRPGMSTKELHALVKEVRPSLDIKKIFPTESPRLSRDFRQIRHRKISGSRFAAAKMLFCAASNLKSLAKPCPESSPGRRSMLGSKQLLS
jgi:hypothetical protein